VTLFHFTGAVAWDVLGTSVRIAANKRSVSIIDPATLAIPTGLVQGGVAVSWITVDSRGRYAFACDAPSVVVDFGAGPWDLTADEVPGMVAAFAVSDDSAVATIMGNSASLSRAVTDPLYVSGVAATQVVMRKLAHDQSADIVILSDSTDDAYNEWGGLFAGIMGAKFPNATVNWRPALSDGSGYDIPTVVTTGTGAAVLNIWNMGIAGSQSYSWQGANFTAQVVTPDPDLVMIASGHNDGTFTGDVSALGQPQVAFRLRYVALCEKIRRAVPAAQIILISQNEWSDGTGDMDLKRDEFRTIAQARGCGFIDFFQAFRDAPAKATYYNALPNIVHINSDGEALFAATVAAAFVADPKWEPRPAPPSLYDSHAVVNLADDMVMPLTAAGPVGWNLDNATVSRDTTNCLSARGYAVRVQSTVTTAPSRIYRAVLDATAVLPWRGKWVLVGADMYRPAANGVDNRFVGRISVSDGVDTSKTFTDDIGKGSFMPRYVPHFVNAAATSLTVSLWADNATGAVNPDVTWDKLYVIPGQWPVGYASKQGTLQIRTQEKFESITLGDSTMSTSPSLILDAAVGVTRDIAVKAGGVNRWFIRIQTAESGTNAGSDLYLMARDDAGAALLSVFWANRKRGNLTLAAWLNLARYATASRPNATTSASEGALAWDSDLHRPLFDDGTIWQVGLLGLSATATLDFASIAAGAIGELTITVTGAAVGDTVALGPPAAIEAGLVWSGFVSAADTVKIRIHNVTAAAIDPASATWKATIIR